MLLYAVAIRVYFLLIYAASLFNAKAGKWIEGRKEWRRQLSEGDFSKHKWVWFHCSSFGEFQDGRSLIETFKQRHPKIKILLTFFSPAGYELQHHYKGADIIAYLPLDTADNCAFFLETVRPCAAFFIRHDVWPNYLKTCNKIGIPAFLVSFTLDDRSSFLRWPLRGFYRKIFSLYHCIFVQYEKDRQLLLKYNFANKAVVAGNTRIDRVLQASIGADTEDVIVKKFVAGSFCIVAGSTHIKDRELFLSAASKSKDEKIKWIIVPHEIDDIEIERAQTEWGEKMMLYSKQAFVEDPKLLWVDRVGLLAGLYRYADLVFIGGGFNKAGIHNMLEPLVYGCPVCFGPNIRGYQEATDLIHASQALIINSENDLLRFVENLRRSDEKLSQAKSTNKAYIHHHAGATEKIMHYLGQTDLFRHL